MIKTDASKSGNKEQLCPMGAVAKWVRASEWRPGGPGFEPYGDKLHFGTLAIPFIPLCQCLSEETLTDAGLFYLASMPEEVKDPTHGVNV